jgi:hypothetical protein
MKPSCLVTTYYSEGGREPTKEELKIKFNADCSSEDIFVNFSRDISPSNTKIIPNIGLSKRKDLVYSKIFLINKFIKNNLIGKYEYICHIDYSDTKFCRSYRNMMERLIDNNTDFIISTEKNCWPYLETVESWDIKKNKLENIDFKYLNSGAFVSKTSTLVSILDELENICLTKEIDFWDDQGVWQYYDLYVNKLIKDHTCEYFFSTGFLDETYYKKIKNKIITKFDTEPYLIHDNSSFSLNLINTI